jgi:hypothetical protein
VGDHGDHSSRAKRAAWDTRSSIPATGGQRLYQIWCRNAAPFCTPATFNLTNAMSAVWVP